MYILRAFLVGAIVVLCESQNVEFNHTDVGDDHKTTGVDGDHETIGVDGDHNMIGKSCQTSDGQHGVCAPMGTCPQVSELPENDKNQTSEDHTMQPSICELNESTPLICCPPTVANLNNCKPPRNLRAAQKGYSYFTVDIICQCLNLKHTRLR